MTLHDCDDCGDRFEVRRKRDAKVYTARGLRTICPDCRQRSDTLDEDEISELDEATQALVRSGTWRET